MNSELKQIAKVIKKANRIALFCHINPDFDALGSVYSMYEALTNCFGKQVSIFSSDKLTYTEKMLFDESLLKKNCNPADYDLFVSCDVSAKNMLGQFEQIFIQKENNVVIDHHSNTTFRGRYSVVDSERSSCCEIVFDLLRALKTKITPQMASYIYAGLSSDTNSFINSNTNVQSFETAKSLIKLGADVAKLNEVLYHTRSKKSIEFKKYLWNNFKIKNDYAYCVMAYEDLQKLNGEISDCDGYSHSLVGIQGVNYGISIVEEAKGFFKVSMRSKVGYNVMVKAEKIGGGGHVCAAGARFYAKNITEAKKKVLELMKGE